MVSYQLCCPRGDFLSLTDIQRVAGASCLNIPQTHHCPPSAMHRLSDVHPDRHGLGSLRNPYRKLEQDSMLKWNASSGLHSAGLRLQGDPIGRKPRTPASEMINSGPVTAASGLDSISAAATQTQGEADEVKAEPPQALFSWSKAWYPVGECHICVLFRLLLALCYLILTVWFDVPCAVLAALLSPRP